MIEIFGKKYITQKEAIQRYKYSSSWFEHRRINKEEPSYIKRGKRRIYYELESTDNWFKEQIKKIE